MDQQNVAYQYNVICLSLEKEGLLTPATTWGDPEDTGLSESSQTQKDTSRRTPLPGGPQRSPVHTDREEMVGARAEAGGGESMLPGEESQLRKMRKFWRRRVVMAAGLHECALCHSCTFKNG